MKKINQNYLWSFIAMLKIIILTMTLYIFSQKYQGYLLTITGIVGIFWVLEGGFNEWNIYNIQKNFKEIEMKIKTK